MLVTYISHVSSENYMDPRIFNPDRFLKGSDINKGESVYVVWSRTQGLFRQILNY